MCINFPVGDIAAKALISFFGPLFSKKNQATKKPKTILDTLAMSFVFGLLRLSDFIDGFRLCPTCHIYNICRNCPNRGRTSPFLAFHLFLCICRAILFDSLAL